MSCKKCQLAKEADGEIIFEFSVILTNSYIVSKDL